MSWLSWGWACARCTVTQNFGQNGILAKYVVFQEVGAGRWGVDWNFVPLADVNFKFSKKNIVQFWLNSFKPFSQFIVFLSADPVTENCALTNWNAVGMWNDVSCDYVSYPFVCEMPAGNYCVSNIPQEAFWR